MHTVGFIIRIYHEAWSPECQTVHSHKNKSIDFRPTELRCILFRKMIACFGIRDLYQAIITKIKKNSKAVQIMLVIRDPM